MTHRIESCVAVVKTCLLQIDMKDFVNMAKRPADGGGSTAFNQDKKLLMDLMTQFYFIRQLWRSDAGLIELPPVVNSWVKK